MDSATEDLYLQKIEEFVYDEDKIVTFRWLSSALGISANDSKHLLEKYVTDHRSLKPNDLAVTYLLSGMIEENNLAFAIVKEEELEDKRDTLINVLSQQIYSLQKCKETDLLAVSLVDYFDMHKPSEVPIIGSVASKSCIKRVFKQKKALPPPQQPTIKGKSSFFTKPAPKSSEKLETKGTEKVNTISTKQNSVKEAETTTNSKNHTKEAASKPKQNGIASFFTRGASKTDLKPKVPETIEEEKKIKVEKVQQTKMDTKDRMKGLVDTDSESEDIISPTQPSQQSKENQKPKRSYKRQKKQKKDSAPSPKRRKRIVEHNDSDSDDIFGSDEKDESMHEDVIENSDEDSEPVLKPPPPLAPKNKKRKFVNRTFEDEDGYCVTRKEWVEASGSEEEEEPEVLKPEVVKPAVPDKKVTKDEPKVKDENKILSKSENDSSGDIVVNGKGKGKGKGGKGKKTVPTNQKTLMSFFTRN